MPSTNSPPPPSMAIQSQLNDSTNWANCSSSISQIHPPNNEEATMLINKAGSSHHQAPFLGCWAIAAGPLVNPYEFPTQIGHHHSHLNPSSTQSASAPSSFNPSQFNHSTTFNNNPTISHHPYLPPIEFGIGPDSSAVSATAAAGIRAFPFGYNGKGMKGGNGHNLIFSHRSGHCFSHFFNDNFPTFFGL
jgi:hypothetical protein